MAILHLRLAEGDQAIAALTHTVGTDDPELAADALTTRTLGMYLEATFSRRCS